VTAMTRTCLNCKWSRWSGPHLGCYYGYEWRAWLPQKKAKHFPFCETPQGRHLKALGCKWEPKEGEEI